MMQILELFKSDFFFILRVRSIQEKLIELKVLWFKKKELKVLKRCFIAKTMA